MVYTMCEVITMLMQIGEFAALVGVSVRTLRYYDAIGLLPPDEVDAQSGYRYYGDAAFCRMQAILFYRELDFPLDTVRAMLLSSDDDRIAALRGQKHLLTLKKERLEHIICAIERIEKGETAMNDVLRDEYTKVKEQYKDEVMARWGDTTAYREHTQRTADYTAYNRSAVGAGLDAIIAEFAAARANGTPPTAAVSLALAAKLQTFITDTQYTCTKEILRCLGEMYVADERFRQNIDRHGDGTAAFMRAAIIAYTG